MFYLDGPDIYIHRGDSASFDIVFGELNEVSTEGTITEDIDYVPYVGPRIVDAMALPAVGGSIEGDKLTLSLDRGSFPVYPPNSIVIGDIYGINWIPENNTPIRFTVKCDTGRLRPVIQKDYVVYNGFVCIDLTSRDTECLPFGEYTWDIRLSFPNADYTEWNTPVNPFKFVVCDVVGNQF